MEQDQQFFDFAAEVGFTKHLGGIAATDEIAALCQIDEDRYVLDVGCGAGVTACYLAQKYGCKVIGVDILVKMVEKSNQRALKEGIADRVEFKSADAQELPFGDEMFDVVLTESATAFPEDKQKAMDEYTRVLKPGGYIALNESTWLRTPPQEIAAWVPQDMAGNPVPLSKEEWRGLLEGAGLIDIDVRVKAIEAGAEAKGMLQRYGCGGMLGIWGRMLALYIRNPAYRRFLKDLRQRGVQPKDVDKYLGYGLYIGRKPA